VLGCETKHSVTQPDMDAVKKFSLSHVKHLVTLEAASFFMMWKDFEPWGFYKTVDKELKAAHYYLLEKEMQLNPSGLILPYKSAPLYPVCFYFYFYLFMYDN
jgi:hypothetical protein